MSDQATAVQPGLRRALGPLTATAIVVGTIIGTGIFQKPQKVAELTQPYLGLVVVLWLLGGLWALVGSLSMAEVAVLFPKAGGNYVFLREAYGRPAAFLWGWMDFWLMRGASLAAMATLLTQSLHDV